MLWRAIHLLLVKRIRPRGGLVGAEDQSLKDGDVPSFLASQVSTAVEIKTYSLRQLCSSIKRHIEDKLKGSDFWVTCEVSSISTQYGSCRFLDLTDMENGKEVARMKARLFSWNEQKIRKQIGEDFSNVLAKGRKVLVQVQVEYDAVHGLSLRLLDVDPAYTVGNLEARKQRTIQNLGKEGLLERNKKIPIPLVIQRVGVVASKTSAGYEDFRKHLLNNEWGLRFEIFPFYSLVQGEKATSDLKNRLLEASTCELDCLVVVRGGGSQLDLEAFNDYELCKALSISPFPVFTGIGHETDQVVCDLVAHRYFKTPTSVADFILNRNLEFLGTVLALARRVFEIALERSSLSQVESWRNQILRSSQNIMHTAAVRLADISRRLSAAPARIFTGHEHRIELSRVKLEGLDPGRILRRGYSITMAKGKPVRAAKDVKPGETLETMFFDKSVVESVVEKRILAGANRGG